MISTSDRSTVRDFFDDYAALLDSNRFEDWLELFDAEAVYEVKARENDELGLPLATMRADSRAMLADRLRALRETQFFAPRFMRHVVSAVGITNSDRASIEAQANFIVIESLENSPSRIHAAGEYRTRFIDDGGPLRIDRLVVIYDGALVDTSMIYPL